MQVRPVKSADALRAFIELPYWLYRNDPVWVAPLRSEQRAQFDPERNPFLDHCEWELFLLEDEGKTVGRIAAFVDTLAIDFWKGRIGLFGYFECLPSAEGARSLLQAASDWLRARGCTSMRGPWSFVSQEWGMVVEGFVPSPVVLAPYNPPYYNDFLSEFGLQKVKDLLCWYVSAAEGYDIPPRIVKATDAVARRYGVRVRQLDMRRYEEEVETVVQLSNASLVGNWGYTPVTQAEIQATARDLKPIIQPKGVLFAEDRTGRPIGFAIALPDVNSLLKGMKGRLFPFGFLKLLLGVPRLRRYRMFALGVIPQFQGKAVDSLLYRALYESIYTPDTWLEINYVLEDNWNVINAISKMGPKPLRRYRVYEMALVPLQSGPGSG